MNYNDPNLQSMLAAQYVIGSLRGRARTRFERLLRQFPKLETEVEQWQNRFAELDSFIEEKTPPEAVWKNIDARLFSENSLIHQPANYGFWRSLGIGASVLASLLALYIVLPLTQSTSEKYSESYISVFQDDEKQAVWAVQIDTKDNALRVNSINVPTIAADQDYQLWLLRPNDQTPVSLGLLPQSGEIELPLVELPYGVASGIAVSLEPKGGSTTGLPTGPVLYVAKLLELG